MEARGYCMIQPVYCARCGAQMERRVLDDRERDVCSVCGYILYRNPVPAVGVVVELDEKVVLVRRRYEPRAGCWALPAGFMELDESAEEAAARECHEETGLLVRVDHLLGVFSFGEGQGTGLLIIYTATVVGGELAAADDATEVGLFAPEALPEPIAFSTHIQAIERWRREARAAKVMQDVEPHDGAFQLRYAERSDSAAILALLLPEHEGDSMGVAAEALLQDRISDVDRPVLIASVGGVVGGVLLLGLHQLLRGWYATIDDLVVAPQLRRQGLGRALVTCAVALAQARGCTVAEAALLDPGAREFLTTCGFSSGASLARRLS